MKSRKRINTSDHNYDRDFHGYITSGFALFDAFSVETFLFVCIISLTISWTQQNQIEDSTNQQYFKVKPSDVQVIEGDIAELQCQVSPNTGAGPVQWAKDGFLLGFDRVIPGYNRYIMIIDEEKLVYNLRIHNTQIDDEGEFECQSQVSLRNGSKQPIRASANLHLIVPPKSLTINGSKANGMEAQNSQYSSVSNIFMVEAKEGEKIVLICLASHSKPPPKIKWYRKNTELLAEAAKTSVNKSVLNNRHTLFTIESFLTLYPKVEEEYKCAAEHPGLSKPLRATVLINIFRAPNAPVIDGFNNGDIVHVDEKLTLKCSSSNGYPPPSVTWFRNGVEIDRSYVVTSRNEVINTLTFLVTPSENFAQYTCEVSNSLTPIPLRENVTLSVLFLPAKITISGPNEVRLTELHGTVITLKCVAHPASPPPFDTKLKWFVDGQEVSSGDEQVEVIKRDKSSWIVSSNLTFTITRHDLNIKTFMCTGYTSALKEESVSAIHKVNVIYAPDFPTLLGIKEGSATVLSGTILKCKCICYSGNPRATLVWLNQDNREISAISSITGSGVTSELVIKAEPKDNGATFKCQAIHPALDQPYFVSFKLTVYYPPERVSIEFSSFIKENDTVKIECISSYSNPASVITLLKNGKHMIDHSEEIQSNNASDAENDENSHSISGSNSGSGSGSDGTNTGSGTHIAAIEGKITRSFSTIVVSAEDNESVITCLATNPIISEGVAREDKVLVVHFKPQFESWRTHLELNEFENKVVNLSAIANPQVERYEWNRVKKSTFNSKRIVQNDLMSISLDKFQQFEEIPKKSIQAHGSILYISNISRYDSGLYICSASNKIGETRALLHIDVRYSGSIVNLELVTQLDRTDRTDKLVPREGDAYFQLHCKVDSNPVTKVKWRKEDIENKDSIDWLRAQFKQEEEHNSMHHQLSILTIFNISRFDAGIYACYASNDVKKISVNIKFKPIILSNQTKIAADIGGSVSVKFICSAHGYPSVDFIWKIIDMMGSSVINNNDFGAQTKYQITRLNAEANTSTFQTELIINGISEADFKSYKCLSRNELGSDEILFELVKKSFPDAPTKLRVLNVSRNSVLIGWQPGFDFGYEQNFRVRYWKVLPEQYHHTIQYSYAYVNSSLNKTVITNLDSDSEYQFSITARNKLGESHLSREVVSVRTLPNLSKRKLDSIYASADEQKLGHNNKFISGNIIEISVIISLLVLVILSITSVLICFYRRRKLKVTLNSKRETKDICCSTNSVEERPFLISACKTLESSCNLETSLLQQQQQHSNKCLYVVDRDCNQFSDTKLPSNFLYNSQPDILIINSGKDHCLEDHQIICDNEINLNEVTIDSNTQRDNYDIQTQQKVKRVNIIVPVMNAYSLSTLTEEDDELL